MRDKGQLSTTQIQQLNNYYGGGLGLLFYIWRWISLVRVKMKTSMAGANFSYQPGQEIEVENEVAAAWEEAGIAEIIEEPKKGKKKSDK